MTSLISICIVLNKYNIIIIKLLKITMKFSNFNLTFVMKHVEYVMEIYVYYVMIISITVVT